jgi:hypothetical protein
MTTKRLPRPRNPVQLGKLIVDIAYNAKSGDLLDLPPMVVTIKVTRSQRALHRL